MLRIICAMSDAAMAANVGGPVSTWHKTFDVDLPEVEKWITTPIGTYEARSFVGIEIVPQEGHE